MATRRGRGHHHDQLEHERRKRENYQITGVTPEIAFPVCPTTGKRIYPDELTARAIAIVRNSARNTKYYVEGYPCMECQGWHVGGMLVGSRQDKTRAPRIPEAPHVRTFHKQGKTQIPKAL